MTAESKERAKVSAAALSVEGLGKTSGDKVAFADVSFEIAALVVLDVAGWPLASKTFNRERLELGTR